MKKGKTSTVFILALEIAAITVLHAVKLSHNEKPPENREISKNISTPQPDLKVRTVYSLAVFK